MHRLNGRLRRVERAFMASITLTQADVLALQTEIVRLLEKYLDAPQREAFMLELQAAIDAKAKRAG